MNPSAPNSKSSFLSCKNTNLVAAIKAQSQKKLNRDNVSVWLQPSSPSGIQSYSENVKISPTCLHSVSYSSEFYIMYFTVNHNVLLFLPQALTSKEEEKKNLRKSDT